MSLTHTLFAGTVLACAGLAPAAVFGPLMFTDASDYTDNFVAGTSSNLFVHDASTGTLQYQATSGVASGTSIIRYQTSDSPAGPNDFLTETVSLDVTFNILNGTSHSAGIITRVQADNTGVLALVNTGSTGVAGSTIQLRLFYGTNATSNTAGTAFFNQTFNLTDGNPIAANSPLKVILTQTAGDDPVFNLTVLDAEGLVATTGDQVLTATDAYNTPGGLALRGSSSFVGTTISIDNFTATAVPEPATAMGLAVLGAGLLLRRRR